VYVARWLACGSMVLHFVVVLLPKAKTSNRVSRICQAAFNPIRALSG
jgi:hypothetical protein